MFSLFRSRRTTLDIRTAHLGTGQAWEAVWDAGNRIQGNEAAMGSPVRRYAAEYIGLCFGAIARQAAFNEVVQEPTTINMGLMLYTAGHEMRVEYGDAMLAGADVPGAPAVPEEAMAAQSAIELVRNAMVSAYAEKQQS